MHDVLLGALVELATNNGPDRLAAAHRPDRSSSTVQLVDRAAVPPAGWLEFAVCVEHRESKGSPTVVNDSGHMGLFQFARAWLHGLPYMVRDRLVRFGVPARVARALRVDLQRIPINRWHPVWQRVGFAEVIDRGGRAAAHRHWGLPGSRCQGLIP